MNTGFKNGALVIEDSATSRTNLGLGTSATQNTTAFLQTANNLSDLASLSTALTNLTVTGKHNVLISLGSMYPALSNGVTIAQVQSTTNLNNYRGWSFPNGVNCYSHMQLPMPKSWNGGNLTATLFCVTSATGSGTHITFDIQAINRNFGDAFDIAFPSITIFPVINPTSTAYDLLMSQETTFTPGGNAFSFPSLLEIRIQRNPLDSTPAPAILVGMLLSLTTNAGNDA